jgi:hypothetical protein
MILGISLDTLATIAGVGYVAGFATPCALWIWLKSKRKEK